MKLAIIGLFVSAFAAQASEIDFSTVIKDLDGNQVRKCDSDTPKCKEATTLATVATDALLAPDTPRDPPSSGETKAKRFSLALKVHSGGKVDLQAEEIVLVKELIAKFFSPLVVGRANEALDPPEKTK